MSEPQLPREVRRRLAIIQHAEEVTGNVAMTCRYYGISRQVYYTLATALPGAGHRRAAGPLATTARTAPTPPMSTWSARSSTCGRTTTSGRPRSRCTSSATTTWRCPSPASGGSSSASTSTGCPASQRYKRLDKRWQRYEKQLPGHQVQIDVKFVEPLKTAARPAVGRRTKYYQFTAIDDCTRLRVLRIYPRCDQKTAIQFVDYVLERLPFPVQVIQTDNGAEFQSAFHYHVLDKGVGHRYIKPRTPRLNGKVERSHRIDAEEFYALLDGARHRRRQGLQQQTPENGRTTTTTIAPTAASAARHPTNDYARKPRPRP